MNEDIINDLTTKVKQLEQELDIKNQALFNLHRDRRNRDFSDNILTWELLAYYMLDNINTLNSYLSAREEFGFVARTLIEYVEGLDFTKLPVSAEKEYDARINYLVDEGIFTRKQDYDGNDVIGLNEEELGGEN